MPQNNYLEVHQHKTSWSLFLVLVNTICTLVILLESQGFVIFGKVCKDSRSLAQQRIFLPYRREVVYGESSPLFEYSEH